MPKILHSHEVNFINNCAFRLSVINPRPRLPPRPVRTKSKYITKNLKHGKTRMAESQLILIWHLIGGEGGVRFVDQSQCEMK